MNFDFIEVGNPVEVAVTDETWVKGTIISCTETRVRVKFDVPVLLIERTRTIKRRWFGKQKEDIVETSRYLEAMTFGMGPLVRERS